MASSLRVDLRHGVPVDRQGNDRRRPVRWRPAHGEDSCSRAGSPLCLSEVSPLTRGDLGVVSPWRARGRGLSDYRVLRPFAWEGTALQPRPDPAPEQSGRRKDHQRVAMAELLHGRDDAHRDTRTCTSTAETGLARRTPARAPALKGEDAMPERITETVWSPNPSSTPASSTSAATACRSVTAGCGGLSLRCPSSSEWSSRPSRST